MQSQLQRQWVNALISTLFMTWNLASASILNVGFAGGTEVGNWVVSCDSVGVYTAKGWAIKYEVNAWVVVCFNAIANNLLWVLMAEFTFRVSNSHLTTTNRSPRVRRRPIRDLLLFVTQLRRMRLWNYVTKCKFRPQNTKQIVGHRIKAYHNHYRGESKYSGSSRLQCDGQRFSFVHRGRNLCCV